VTEGRGRRGKQPLYDLKATRGYWELKQEALDRTLWRTRFVGSYKPVLIQTTWWWWWWWLSALSWWRSFDHF